MSDARSINEENWINPAMLKWAREWRGRSIEEAAAKVKKSPQHIVDWERGAARPTVRQARDLADFYDRAFLEFFLPEPHDDFVLPTVPDYRMQAGKDRPADNWELRDIQRWVVIQRENALDLFEEIGDAPPTIPVDIFTTTDSNPSDAARRAREVLGFRVQDQLTLTASEAIQLPTLLRQHFESLGILTLRRSDLKTLGIRGICLAEFPLPVIVFRSEAPAAQAFTLAHELAHVVLRQSAITGPKTRAYDRQPVERWCDLFAAALLMPADLVRAIFGDPPRRPAESIDDEKLKRLANNLRVSPHAMLIRLVHLGYVQPSYYWDVKKPQFDAAEGEYRSGGRSEYYGSRFRSSLGDLYTRLVLEAWSSGRITDHNAVEYMGIPNKNLAHLYAIREKFGSS
jgi:Zn-dependent peptidase ImmA (M78 family)/DNA-binding XRE family transcriptional regulator